MADIRYLSTIILIVIVGAVLFGFTDSFGKAGRGAIETYENWLGDSVEDPGLSDVEKRQQTAAKEVYEEVVDELMWCMLSQFQDCICNPVDLTRLTTHTIIINNQAHSLSVVGPDGVPLLTKPLPQRAYAGFFPILPAEDRVTPQQVHQRFFTPAGRLEEKTSATKEIKITSTRISSINEEGKTSHISATELVFARLAENSLLIGSNKRMRWPWFYKLVETDTLPDLVPVETCVERARDASYT